MGEYNVFLAWSGPVSKAVAQAWRDWLPSVIQAAKPWMSSTDIPKGIPWFGELADQLKAIRIGIICVTPDNLSAPSIHFEAGTLSKTVAEPQFVCPYLFEVKDSDLGFPLAHFQTTKAEQEDTKRLLHTVHSALQSASLTEEQLDKAFDKWWPDLHKELDRLARLESGQQRPHRKQEEILEELLEIVRDLARQPYIIPRSSMPSVLPGNSLSEKLMDDMTIVINSWRQLMAGANAPGSPSNPRQALASIRGSEGSSATQASHLPRIRDSRLATIKVALAEESKFLASCLNPLTGWRFENGEAQFSFSKQGSWAAELLQNPKHQEKLRATCEKVLGQPVKIHVTVTPENEPP
jgi:hypothetical protein